MHSALSAKAAKVTERFENAAFQTGTEEQLEMASAAPPQEASLLAEPGRVVACVSAQGGGMLLQDFADFARSALELRGVVAEFGNEMKDLVDKLLRCLDALQRRAGDTDELTLLIETARAAHSDHDLNMESFNNCIDYIATASELSAWGDSDEAASDASSFELKHRLLCDFSRIHVVRSAGFHIKTTDSFDEADDIVGLGTFEGVMSKFCMIVGQGLYDKHCKAKLAECFNQILKYSLEVVAVHHDVLQGCGADKKFPYLIRKPSLDDMRMERLDLGGSRDDERIFENLEFNQGLSFLKEFADIIGAQYIDVPGATHADEKELKSGMLVEYALFFADLACATREAGMVAAHLQQDLMIPISAGKKLQDEAIYGQVAYEIKLYMTTVTKLEDIISSPSCMACEKSAWQLPVSLATMRAWAKCMSIVGGDMQAMWLKEVSSALALRSQECASAVPSWSACFEAGRLLPAVAQKILVGRLGAVVAAHNGVHKLMTQLASAASLLEVSPRLQEHTLTIDSVRVAFDIMAKANEATIVILGPSWS